MGVAEVVTLLLLALGSARGDAPQQQVSDKANNATSNSKGTEIIWTIVEKEVGGGKKKFSEGAFRDLVIEMTGQKIFETFMEKVRHPQSDEFRVLRDPMYLREGIKLKKRSSMFEISLVADTVAVHGLHGLRLTYMRVIRHFGLRDIKFNVRIGGDLRIAGRYNLEGQALGFVPVTGKGGFTIDVKDFSVSGISFLVLDEGKKDDEDDRLTIRELEVSVDHKEVKLNFEGLMGGGMVGSVANQVINGMGEAIIDSQKQQIIKLLRKTFKEEVSRYV